MIIDKIRDKEELKKLYEERPMPIQYDWDFLLNNPFLFCFYDEENGKLRGFITLQREFFEELNKTVLTLSGTSVRGNMADNIDAIISVCNALNDDVYAYTELKHAVLVLKKSGFKKVTDNIYLRGKNG